MAGSCYSQSSRRALKGSEFWQGEPGREKPGLQSSKGHVRVTESLTPTIQGFSRVQILGKTPEKSPFRVPSLC